METIIKKIKKLISAIYQPQNTDTQVYISSSDILRNVITSGMEDINKNRTTFPENSYEIEMSFDNGLKVLKLTSIDAVNFIGHNFNNCLKNLYSLDERYFNRGTFYCLVKTLKDGTLKPQVIIFHEHLVRSIRIQEIESKSGNPAKKIYFRYINAFLAKKELSIFVSSKAPTFNDYTLALALYLELKKAPISLTYENQLMNGLNQSVDTTPDEGQNEEE